MNTKLTLKLTGPKRLTQESATFCRCFVHGLVEVSSRLVDVWCYSSHFEPCNLKDTPFTDHSRPTICQAASSADSEFRHLGHCLEYGESLVRRVLRHVKSAIPGSGNAWIASKSGLKMIQDYWSIYIVIPYNSSITRCLNHDKHDGCSRLQCGFGYIEFVGLSWGFFQLVHVVPCWQRWV